MEQKKLSASVIIPTYNKLPRLKLVMYSLEYQKIDFDLFEVIVIDDGSKDSSYQKVLVYVHSYQNSWP